MRQMKSPETQVLPVLNVVKKSRGLWEHTVGITDQFASQERLSGGGDI